MDKAQAKALADGISLSSSAPVDYQSSIDTIVDKCYSLRAKLAKDLKPHVTFDLTMDLVAEAESDRTVGSIRNLQPFVTNELELRKQELAKQEKRLEENKQDLAVFKAKLQDLKSSHPI